MKLSKPSPRLAALFFLLVNVVALVNLGVLWSPDAYAWLMGFYILAIVEGGVSVLKAPGISWFGQGLYLVLVGLVLVGLYPWPGSALNQWVAFGPALIVLSATLIVVGPGWNETAHRK